MIKWKQVANDLKYPKYYYLKSLESFFCAKMREIPFKNEENKIESGRNANILKLFRFCFDTF